MYSPIKHVNIINTLKVKSKEIFKTKNLKLQKQMTLPINQIDRTFNNTGKITDLCLF